jgi:hypothetical protein
MLLLLILMLLPLLPAVAAGAVARCGAWEMAWILFCRRSLLTAKIQNGDPAD